MKTFRITPPGKDNFIMPGEIVSYLATATEAQIKTYIYCLSRSEANAEDGASACGISKDEFVLCVDFWCGCGMLSIDEKKPLPKKQTDLLQSYDGETLAKAIENDETFSSLKASMEDMLGTILNKNDINLLYNLYHFSGLDSDYVCTVAAYAVSRGKGNMMYITRTALELYDEGADNFEKLEKLFAVRQESETNRSRFISLCGFGSRKLTPKEENYIARWFSEFSLPFDVVKTAYEKMIDSIGEVKLPYLDKILTDWYKLGVKNASDAAEASNARKNTLPSDSFDVSEFVEAALKKGVK